MTATPARPAARPVTEAGSTDRRGRRLHGVATDPALRGLGGRAGETCGKTRGGTARQVLAAQGSDGERHLETRLRQHGIPFEREVQVVAGRNFRADFRVAPDLLVEVDGGSWTGGRHTSGSGFERDCEKASLAAIAGYRVIRCTTAQVEDDRCLDWIRAALP